MLNWIVMTLVILVMTCASAPNVRADTAKVKKKTTITVYRQDPNGPAPTSCPFQGQGCTITTVIEEETAKIVSSYPGYMLQVGESNILVQVERNGQTVSNLATNRSITFPSGTVYEIVSCPEHPNLVGTLINVSGVTTNSLGGFSVFFIP